MGNHEVGDRVTVTNTLLPDGEAGVVQDITDSGVYHVSVPSLGLVAASDDDLTAVEDRAPEPVVDAPYTPTVISIDPPASV